MCVTASTRETERKKERKKEGERVQGRDIQKERNERQKERGGGELLATVLYKSQRDIAEYDSLCKIICVFVTFLPLDFLPLHFIHLWPNTTPLLMKATYQ